MMPLIIFLIFCSTVFADQVMYYDPVTERRVIDLSGVKDEKIIKEEYGLISPLKKSFNPRKEVVRVKDGELEKINLTSGENAAMLKLEEKKKRVGKLKMALEGITGKELTDKQIEDLIEAIK